MEKIIREYRVSKPEIAGGTVCPADADDGRVLYFYPAVFIIQCQILIGPRGLFSSTLGKNFEKVRTAHGFGHFRSRRD